MSLLYISQELTIFGGFILLLAGVIGNSLNIFIFLAERNYRQNPSTFFFLIASIINNMHLIFNLVLRILSVGYKIDLTVKYSSICRLRGALLTSFGLISLTCICLASIDQFLTTSRHQFIRRFSEIKWAHRLLFLLIIIWFCHGIFYLVFFDIVNGICINTNPIFKDYGTYSYFVYFIGLPILTLVVFGYLSYRNIRQVRVLVDQRADRQITRMTLMQTIVVCISITPYGILNVYAVVTSGIVKSLDQQMKEYLASAIINLISYIHFSSSFYIFCIASKRFRRTFINRILCGKRPTDVVPSHIT